ncbi:hypothetical protein SLS55_010278 [Diplodia seriata]|uniref:Uncharacterized protein n=1 Tax=Diplodia seriata TaxID=420778 RepID=A0ABR3BYU9_9PEZI
MDFRHADAPHFTETRTQHWPNVPTWSEWSEFNHASLENIMGPLLDEEFDLPDKLPDVPAALLVADNEHVFQFELIKHSNIVVNTAVDVISKRYPNLVTTCWAHGQAALANQATGYPDFSTIPLKPRDASEGKKPCVCPGDAKYYDREEVSFPTSLEQQTGGKKHWAQQCLRQVCHYSVKRETRYFYLLTPEGAVIGRRRHSDGGRIVRPEIVIVPWDAPRGKVNVNTALLFTLIAAGLDHGVKASYPSLVVEYGHSFPH